MRGISVIQRKATPIQVEQSKSQIPCYVGQAPIWQVDDANWQNLAGQAFLVSSIEEMRNKVGFCKPASGAYSKDISLCCAAMYNLSIMLTAPIVILVNKQSITVGESQTDSLTFANGVAKIASNKVVLSSVGLTGKTKGTDYVVAYDEDGQNVIIKALTTMDTATATYTAVNTASLSFSADTFDELDYFEQEVGVVPATIGCPLWDSETITGLSMTVGQKLSEVIQEPLNGHWYVQGYINLSGTTITEANTDKAKYTSFKTKACWPSVKKDACYYPMSVVFMAIKEMVDMNASGVPYISASNETIIMDSLCTDAGAAIRLKEADSTGLNDNGIATANFSNMEWVTWGVCMANYQESNKSNIDADQLNDVAVQMKDYVSNLFQQTYAKQLDKPMLKRAANDIVVSFQGMLDALVTIGALVYAKVEFLTSANPVANLADGTFTFTITETNTPPGKAIIGEVSYSAEALKKYYAEGGAES